MGFDIPESKEIKVHEGFLDHLGRKIKQAEIKTLFTAEFNNNLGFLISPLKKSLIDYIFSDPDLQNDPEGSDGFPLFDFSVCVDVEAVSPTLNKAEKYIINCTIST